MACEGGNGGINNFTIKAKASVNFVWTMTRFKQIQQEISEVKGKTFIDDFKGLFATQESDRIIDTSSGSVQYSVKDINNNICGSDDGCNMPLESANTNSQPETSASSFNKIYTLSDGNSNYYKYANN
jgi:hypothetical protein